MYLMQKIVINSLNELIRVPSLVSYSHCFQVDDPGKDIQSLAESWLGYLLFVLARENIPAPRVHPSAVSLKQESSSS